MSWAKRNLYFLISCIAAVVLLGAAGWYCYSEWQGNNQSWEALNQAYSQLNEINNKPITPNKENVEAARNQVKDIETLNNSLHKFLSPISPIPNTGKIDDRTLAFAVRETISQLRVEAGPNITLPQDYAFSFSAQRDKAVYVPQSWGQLAQQLGEVKTICDILYSNRISSLDGIQREHTADDLGATTQQPDYLDYTSITNNGSTSTTILTPYQVTFGCFDTELGGVLASFANQPYGIMVRTLEVEPAEMATTEMNYQPQVPTFQYPPAGAAPYRGGGAPYRGGVPQYRSAPAPPPVMPAAPAVSAPAGNLPMVGGLPVIVDEKRLKITMMLEVVKVSSTPGR